MNFTTILGNLCGNSGSYVLHKILLVKIYMQFLYFTDTFSFSLDNVLLHICVINNDEIGVVHAKEDQDGCTGRDILSNHKLTKYSCRTGTKMETAKLGNEPNGIVPISLAGKPCVALSYHSYNQVFP